MHADQHVVAAVVGDVAAHQRDVLDVVVDARVADRAELAVPGRDARLGDALDVLLVLAPPLDEVGDRDQRQVVLVGEDPQLVGLRHRALVLLADDLADRARGLQPGQPGQVDGGLGVARAGAARHRPWPAAERRGPGRVKSSATLVGSASSRIVVARSEAEMPVPTPFFASTVTV